MIPGGRPRLPLSVRTHSTLMSVPRAASEEKEGPPRRTERE